MTCSLLSRGWWISALATIALNSQAASDYSTPYAFTTLAGVSSIGSQGGPGTAARFYLPAGMTADSKGNIYLTDEGNSTIRKVTPDGIVTTIAGKAGEPGSVDGVGTDARFDSPQGIVADTSDNLYVADTGNHTIRKITPEGVVTTLSGLAGVTGNSDGVGIAARFDRPRGIAADSANNLYITEAGNRHIRKITPDGTVSSLQSGGRFPEASYEGTPGAYGSITVDADGYLYVTSFIGLNHRNYYDEFGTLTTAEYFDYIGFVQKIDPNKDAPSYIRQTTVELLYPGGRLIENDSVAGLAIDENGKLVMSPEIIAIDHMGNRYHTVDNHLYRTGPNLESLSVIAGISLTDSNRTIDGSRTEARFEYPIGTAVDAAGNVYVADGISHCIRKITPAGMVTTLAGTPGVAGSADGTGPAAKFDHPSAVAVDGAGTVYVADTNNHAIRRISALGEVSTLAGSPGSSGSDDGTGTDARFYLPQGIAVDSAGNLFVADSNNRIIREITPTGTVTTIAGTAGQTGSTDGKSDVARFYYPVGITVDAANAIYITDAYRWANIATVRKITPNGMVSTLAGNERGYADGSGASARFFNPAGIAVDHSGNLFIADTDNQSVRKVAPDGAVSTVAGLADAPSSTDGAGRNARFYYPQGIAVDTQGLLYVTSGTTVRKGQLAGAPVISVQPQSQTVTTGGSVQFSVGAGGIPEPTYQWYFKGSPFAGATSSTLSFTNANASDAGDYTVVVTNELGSVTSNQATLTVSSATPPPSSGGGSSSGGAPSGWFLLTLGLAGALKKLTHRTRR